MELTNCPMCQSSIPSDAPQPVTACAVCGADLTRFAAKKTAVPPPLAPVEAGEPVKAASEFNLTHGILGAVAGAAVGGGAIYGLFAASGIVCPLFGLPIGAATGYGAKLLFKGTDHSLGVVSAVVSVLAVAGTVAAIYGISDFPILRIISIAIGASVAYRIAS